MPRLPVVVSALFRVLTPIAERDEVLADLQAEYAWRAGEFGRAAARALGLAAGDRIRCPCSSVAAGGAA